METKYNDFIGYIVGEINNKEIDAEIVKMVVKLLREPVRIYIPVETPTHFPRKQKHGHIYRILQFINNNHAWIIQFAQANSMILKSSYGLYKPFDDGPNNKKVLYMIDDTVV